MADTLVNPATNVTATPNANVTPAQQSAAQAQGFTNTPSGNPITPMSVDTLGKGGSPISVPPASSPATSYNPVPPPQNTTAGTNGLVSVNPPADTSNGNSDQGGIRSWIQNNLFNDTTQLGTKGAVTTQLQNDNNLSDKTTQAATDYNALQQAKIDQQNEIARITQNATGQGKEGVAQDIANYKQSSDAHIANLTVAAQGSQNLLDAAQKTISDKVSAQFQPFLDNADMMGKMATFENADLSESQKFQLQQKSDQMKTDATNVQKAASDIQTELLKNGNYGKVAPQIDKIIADYTAGKMNAAQAQSQIFAAAGKFGSPVLTVDEAAKLGVPYGTTQQEAYGKTTGAGSGGLSSDVTNFWAQAGSSGVNMNSLLPSIGMGAAAVGIKTALLSSIANQAKTLGISGSDFAAMLADSKAKQKAMTQLQSQGSMSVVNEQSANKYFDTLSTLADKADSSIWKTGAPLIDGWIKTGVLATSGNPDVNNFTTQMTEALTEYAKVLSGQTTGSGVTQYAASTAKGLLDKGFSASTIKSFINVAKGNMSDRIGSYNSALKGLFGNIENIQKSTGGVGTGTSVNIGGNDYAVGSMVQNSNGQKGIVNADGTITPQ